MDQSGKAHNSSVVAEGVGDVEDGVVEVVSVPDLKTEHPASPAATSTPATPTVIPDHSLVVIFIVPRHHQPWPLVCECGSSDHNKRSPGLCAMRRKTRRTDQKTYSRGPSSSDNTRDRGGRFISGPRTQALAGHQTRRIVTLSGVLFSRLGWLDHPDPPVLAADHQMAG